MSSKDYKIKLKDELKMIKFTKEYNINKINKLLNNERIKDN